MVVQVRDDSSKGCGSRDGGQWGSRECWGGSTMALDYLTECWVWCWGRRTVKGHTQSCDGQPGDIMVLFRKISQREVGRGRRGRWVETSWVVGACDNKRMWSPYRSGLNKTKVSFICLSLGMSSPWLVWCSLVSGTSHPLSCCSPTLIVLPSSLV